MKNQQVNKSFKANLHTSMPRDPNKVPHSNERQSILNASKTEEICHSARNWKIEGSGSAVGLESLRNRGLISPIVSPKSKYPNLPYAFSNRHNQSLHRASDKSNSSIYVGDNQPGGKSELGAHIANTSHELAKYRSFHPTNVLTTRELKNSAPNQPFLEVFKKIPSMPQDGAHSYALHTDRHFPLEIASAREVNLSKALIDANQSRKTLTNYPAQIKQKTINSDYQEENLNVIGSAINPNGSPTKNLIDNSKGKIKEQYPLANLISGKTGMGNDSFANESASTNPTKKKDSIPKQSTSISNNMNNNVQEGSEISRRGESQASKDTSYSKESSKIDEKHVTGRLIKRVEGSVNVMRNFQINKQRPDSSFDKNHMFSVRSVDLNHITHFEEEQKPFPKLKNSNLDILDTDDRFKKENMHNEKSKKNFYQFHNKLFTENSKRLGGSQNEMGTSFASHLIKDTKTLDGKIQQFEGLKSHPLEINLNSPELPSLEALVSPYSKTEKPLESTSQLISNKSRKVVSSLRGDNLTRNEILSTRKQPNTTKNQDREFKISFEDQNMLRFGKRVISQNSDQETQAKTNKSMTLSFHDRSHQILKYTNKTSRTLTNEELDEKMPTEKPSHSKNLSFGATNDTEGNVTVPSEERKTSSPEQSEKKESHNMDIKLKELYDRIKVDLLKSRTEKSEWLLEKRQLLEKIELLEKRVIELEAKK